MIKKDIEKIVNAFNALAKSLEAGEVDIDWIEKCYEDNSPRILRALLEGKPKGYAISNENLQTLKPFLAQNVTLSHKIGDYEFITERNLLPSIVSTNEMSYLQIPDDDVFDFWMLLRDSICQLSIRYKTTKLSNLYKEDEPCIKISLKQSATARY